MFAAPFCCVLRRLRTSRSFCNLRACLECLTPGAEGPDSAAGPPMMVVVVLPSIGAGRPEGRKASSKLLVPRSDTTGASSSSMGSLSSGVTARMVWPTPPSEEVVLVLPPPTPPCCRGRLWRLKSRALFSARSHSAYSEACVGRGCSESFHRRREPPPFPSILSRSRTREAEA